MSKGYWYVSFPDIESSVTTAPSFEDGIMAAQKILGESFAIREACRILIPKATPIDKVPKGVKVQYVVVSMKEFREKLKFIEDRSVK